MLRSRGERQQLLLLHCQQKLVLLRTVLLRFQQLLLQLRLLSLQPR